MKTMITTALATLLLIGTVDLELAKAGHPYESDDYGFPVEPDSTYQRRTRPGRGFWTNQRAARNLRHSRDYSRDMYRYSQSTKKIKPAVIKSESEEMRRCIEQAQQELTVATSDSPGDSKTVIALRSIQDHLTKAAGRHDELHKECCKISVDGKVTMQCCADITKHLESAMAEHTALMQSMENQALSHESTLAVPHQHR